MRYIAAFAAIMSLLTVPARCKGNPEDELAKAAFAFEVAKLNLKPTPAKKTTCGCGLTGSCTCWKSECQCSSCGLAGTGGAAKEVKKPSVSQTTGTTLAPRAVTPVPREQGLGRYEGTPLVEPTFTPAQNAASSGSISGCPNGQCQSAATYRRGYFFKR